jgi:hypothetical protein
MVYVDNFKLKKGRYYWCHMLADTLKELHTMAKKIGLKSSWFQNKSRPFYDLTLFRKQKALENGATEMYAVDIVRHLKATNAEGWSDEM